MQMAQHMVISKLGELSPKEKNTSTPDVNQLAKHLPQPLNT